MSVLLLDCEKGSLSVNGLIKSGRLTRLHTRRFNEVDKAVWDVLRGKIKPDLVVIDTLTTLATTTRLDIIIDPDNVQAGSLWENRGMMTGSQRDWGDMSTMLTRCLRMLRDHDVPSVLVCHEGEREDPVTGIKKEGPDLNAALLKDVYAMTDALVRLSIAERDFKTQEGDFKAGTRVLRLAASATAMGKVRVPDDMPNPAPVIANPTFTKFVDACGGVLPENITLYGASGVGKTRFIGSACDYFDTLSQAQTTPTQVTPIINAQITKKATA